MRYASAIILALPTLAFGASLSDFKPYLEDLPTACDVIYRTQIPGCKDTDFKSGRGCSDSCISGLTATVQVVKAACGSAKLPGNDVITGILGGNGVGLLCPNAPSAAATTSSTSSATPTTTSTSTTSTPTSTSTADSTSTTSTTQTTTSASTASTTGSSASSSTSGKTSTAQVTSASSASTAGSSSTTTSGTASAQSATRTGGNNSGGGSPFDTNGNGAASGTSIQVQLVFSAALIAALALLR